MIEIRNLQVKPDGESGVGAALSTGLLTEKVVQFIGGTGSWNIEASLDGQSFHSVLTVTGPGLYPLAIACAAVRINANENTTAPKVLLGGYAL